MNARDWFSLVRDRLEALARLEDEVAKKKAAVLPKGQKFEPSSHGGASDSGGAMIGYIQQDSKLDAMRAECDILLERATDVLYGRSGRGGLAKARSTADADCICGRYLMGMKWQEVADELVRPESRNGAHWCLMRACRAFEYMDRVGMSWLMNS